MKPAPQSALLTAVPSLIASLCARRPSQMEIAEGLGLHKAFKLQTSVSTVSSAPLACAVALASGAQA